jgi:cellulose biosynthesis protein BcsQ
VRRAGVSPEPVVIAAMPIRPAGPPLTVAVAHSKGGVGKTTTALLLGRFLAERWRVALADYDETAHLTALVADLRVIDSPPSRGSRTERALAEADWVLIPAPPERMALRALRQMFETVDEVRASSRRWCGGPGRSTWPTCSS